METLTTSEVAAVLGVSDQTVRDLIVKGTLPGERLVDGGWYRVRKDQLIEFANSKRITLNWDAISK